MVSAGDRQKRGNTMQHSIEGYVHVGYGGYGKAALVRVGGAICMMDAEEADYLAGGLDAGVRALPPRKTARPTSEPIFDERLDWSEIPEDSTPVEVTSDFDEREEAGKPYPRSEQVAPGCFFTPSAEAPNFGVVPLEGRAQGFVEVIGVRKDVQVYYRDGTRQEEHRGAISYSNRRRSKRNGGTTHKGKPASWKNCRRKQCKALWCACSVL